MQLPDLLIILLCQRFEFYGTLSFVNQNWSWRPCTRLYGIEYKIGTIHYHFVLQILINILLGMSLGQSQIMIFDFDFTEQYLSNV